MKRFTTQFLGVFAKLRKATISFVMSVCPSFRLSVRMKQFGSHGTSFDKIRYLRLFQISVGKGQVLLKSNKNNG